MGIEVMVDVSTGELLFDGDGVLVADVNIYRSIEETAWDDLSMFHHD